MTWSGDQRPDRNGDVQGFNEAEAAPRLGWIPAVSVGPAATLAGGPARIHFLPRRHVHWPMSDDPTDR